LTASSLVAGNAKLNLAFVANLFNTWPGLEPLEENEKPVIEEFDAEGEREARVFTLWLNSLDVDPGVHDLFEDLKVRRVDERHDLFCSSVVIRFSRHVDLYFATRRTASYCCKRSTR
jgi:hypothetical protein